MLTIPPAKPLAAAVASLCLLSPHAQAQVTKVAPAGFGYETRYGETASSTPFGGLMARNQQLIAFGALGFGLGPITQVAYRRSSGTTAFGSDTKTTTCKIGYSDWEPQFMPSSFSAVPKGTPTTVYNGPLSIPAAPPPATPPAPFSIAIPFTAPWVFINTPANGKSLMLDVYSAGTVSLSWNRDGRLVAGDGKTATSTSLGVAGCNASNALAVTATLQNPYIAIPGGTMQTTSANWPLALSSAFAFLGVNGGAPYPVDLAVIGAPGCMLRTDILLSQAVPTQDPAATFTRAYAFWPIPNNPLLVGQQLNSQWAAIDPPANQLGLIVSSAIRITLGTAPTRAYATQCQWQYSPSIDAGLQTANSEFGGIVEFTGQLQ